MILTGCSSSSTETKDTKRQREIAKKKEVKNTWSKSQGFKIFEDYKQYWKEDHSI